MIGTQVGQFPAGREPQASGFIQHFQDLKKQSRAALLSELNSGERPILDESLNRRPYTSPQLPHCLKDKVLSTLDPEDMTADMRRLELGLVLAAAQEFPGSHGNMPLLARASELVDRFLSPAQLFGEAQMQSLLDQASKNWGDQCLGQALGVHRVGSMHAAERQDELAALLRLYLDRPDLHGSIRLETRIRNLIGADVSAGQLQDEKWHSALIERAAE